MLEFDNLRTLLSDKSFKIIQNLHFYFDILLVFK